MFSPGRKTTAGWLRTCSSSTRVRASRPAEKFHALNHRLAKFFLDSFLHRLGHELQIAVVANMKSDFVPNVRELTPRIIINWFIQHLGVGELDDAAARLIGGE